MRAIPTPNPFRLPCSLRSSVATGLLYFGLGSALAHSAPALWFPDPPSTHRFDWRYEPCDGCAELRAHPGWREMGALAGVPDVRFQLAPDEASGLAYSMAPDVVVVSPSALKLERCELAFIVGHEIVHIARRHFDEDANAIAALSQMPANWTDQGSKVMQLADGDFHLALQLSELHKGQEREADWLGALLAARACGCDLEAGALAFLHSDEDTGGGLAFTHKTNMQRIRDLRPFVDTAQRLADRSADPQLK